MIRTEAVACDDFGSVCLIWLLFNVLVHSSDLVEIELVACPHVLVLVSHENVFWVVFIW